MSLRIFFAIFSSMLVAIILQLLPLPGWTVHFQPEWLALVVLFWSLRLEMAFPIVIAWFAGLILDLLYGTLLGEHALALVVVAYLAIKMHRRYQLYLVWQKALCVFILVMIYRIIILFSQGIIGDFSFRQEFWLPAVSSVAVWPVIMVVLQDYARLFFGRRLMINT